LRGAGAQRLKKTKPADWNGRTGVPKESYVGLRVTHKTHKKKKK